MKLNLILLGVFVFLLLPIASSSIGPGAILTGNVKDLDGSASSGASVQVTNLENSYSATASTNEFGEWAVASSYSAGDSIYVYADDTIRSGTVTETVGGNMTVVLTTIMAESDTPTISPGGSSGSRMTSAANTLYVVEGYIFIDDEPVPADVKIIITNLNTSSDWVTYTVNSNDYTNYYVTTITASPGDIIEIKARYDGYTGIVKTTTVTTASRPAINVYITSDGERTIEELKDKETIETEESKKIDILSLVENPEPMSYVVAAFALFVILAYGFKLRKEKK
jgi:hypothetical protein